jgi:hypothetical protein
LIFVNIGFGQQKSQAILMKFGLSDLSGADRLLSPGLLQTSVRGDLKNLTPSIMQGAFCTVGRFRCLFRPYLACQGIPKSRGTLTYEGCGFRVGCIEPPHRIYQGGVPMITDTEIKIKGIKALTESLGCVDAERFIALIQREPQRLIP